jgi:Flp pilus assembly protein CpaB
MVACRQVLEELRVLHLDQQAERRKTGRHCAWLEYLKP